MLPEIWFCWLLVCVWLRRRRPERLDREERNRLKSIAEMTARHAVPLSEKEAAFVADHVAVAEKWTTTEHPIVEAVVIRPKARRVVRRNPLKRQQAEQRKRMQLATARLEFDLDPLNAPLLAVDKPAPVLSSVRSFEPEPWHLESFTQGWTRAQIAELVAAGAPAGGPP